MLEINNTTRQKINEVKTKKIVEAFLVKNKKQNFTVSLAVVGALRMKSLNNIYRGLNKTTDVLSFSADYSAGNSSSSNSSNIFSQLEKHQCSEKFLGEVIINIEEIKKTHKYLEVFGKKKSAEYIFYFLLIHGLLHLLGYTDDKEAERQKMLSLGKRFLEGHL